MGGAEAWNYRGIRVSGAIFMKKQAKRMGFTATAIESSLRPIGPEIERQISGGEESGLIAVLGPDQHSNTPKYGNLPDECLLAMLEAENIQLRNQVVELALEVLDLQVRSEGEAESRAPNLKAR
jgi:hypothetical protein